MHFPHHKVEETQVLKGMSCTLSEELLINPNNFITRSGIFRSTMGIWDEYKRNFTEPNELHNEESTESMFEGTGLEDLYLDQDSQAVLKKNMRNFYEAYIHKPFSRSKFKEDETITIPSRSRQIKGKLQTRTKKAPPPGFNIAPAKYPFITSGLTEEDVEDEDISLLRIASLAIEPSGDNISLLVNGTSLIGNDVYPP